MIAARQATRWNVAGLLCLLAALGPVLRLGPPTVEFLRASEHAAPDQLGWPLPYRLAYELIPGVATGRSPWRWVGAAHVCLAMAAACGMAGLAQRLARAGVWGTRLTVAGGMLVAGVSLAEALPHRLDLTRATAYILLPLSVVFALVFVSQGMLQNLSPYREVTTLELVHRLVRRWVGFRSLGRLDAPRHGSRRKRARAGQGLTCLARRWRLRFLRLPGRIGTFPRAGTSRQALVRRVAAR